MILTCPDCKTRYLVNPAKLRPDGRVVRCAKCGTAWKEEAPAPEPDEPAPLADEAVYAEPVAASPTYERPVRVRPMASGSNLPAIREPKKSPEFLGWLGLISFVALVLGSGYVFRGKISEAWAPSRKLYDILGIDTRPQASPPAPARIVKKPVAALPSTDLLFQNLVATPRYDGNVLVLTFQGTIANPTGDAIVPTRISAVAKDEQGNDLKTWSFTVDQHIIPGHGSTTFSTEFRDAPPQTRRIVPVFVANE